MNFIFEEKYTQFLIDWVRARVPHMEDVIGRAIGVVDDGEILAVALYYNYSERFRSVEMAFASDHPRWASKSNIRVLLDYPFNDLNCNRITLIVPRKNKRARKFVEGLGFVEEGKARKAFIRDDAIIYGLLKSETYKWLRAPLKVA